MVDAHHEIAEMDLNPVIAGPGGSVAVDYRIRVHAAPPVRPWRAEVEVGRRMTLSTDSRQLLSAQSRSASASIRSSRV